MKKSNNENFKVLLVYPNLSMMMSPPVAYGVFTRLLRAEGYEVDIFDCTPYIGEGSSVDQTRESVIEKPAEEKHKGATIAFQTATTEEQMAELMQARPFSYEEDLGIRPKIGMYEDFVSKVEEFQPDLMTFSIVEDCFYQSVKLISLVEDKNIPTLCGGVFITAAPELAMTYPEVKMIGVGEGEQIVLDVAQRVKNNKMCDDVPGVWVRKDDGSIIRNKRGPLYDFINVIPDYSLFESKRFQRPMGGFIYKALPIESYRGCPYTCAYCNSPMQQTLSLEAELGTFVRRNKNMDKLRDYIADIIKQEDPTYFKFVDDSFMARPQDELADFCRMYEEFKIPFWFNTRPENVSVENMQMLKEVNCNRIAFGIECGNEKFRKDVLSRSIKNETLVKKFKIISDSGIAFSVNNIIGFPGETRELIFDTIRFTKNIKGYDALSVTVFVPYNGTPLRKVCEEQGLIGDDVIIYDMFHSALNMTQLQAREIDGLLRTFPLYVHFDEKEWDTIKIAEGSSEEGKQIYKEYSARYHDENFSLDQDARIDKNLAPNTLS
jgi:radical SAM superfamily enzyme YgiQ (UPF0313 family)